MQILSAFSVLALAAAATAVPHHRIVGGYFTDEGDFPEMVSVFSDPLIGNKQHLCGGIILNDNHVLTTATCVNGHSTGSLYVMGAGINLEELTGYEEIKDVNRKTIHHAYDPVTKANDLAILRLSHNFVFVTGLITPAVLPTINNTEPAADTELTAVGWGMDAPEGVLQVRQKAVDMLYVTRETCSDVFGTFVQPNEGCLKSEKNEGICMRDEGGVVRDKSGTTTAMVSWHVNCHTFPAVVTLLAPYYDWIVSHFDS